MHSVCAVPGRAVGHTACTHRYHLRRVCLEYSKPFRVTTSQCAEESSLSVPRKPTGRMQREVSAIDACPEPRVPSYLPEYRARNFILSTKSTLVDGQLGNYLNATGRPVIRTGRADKTGITGAERGWSGWTGRHETDQPPREPIRVSTRVFDAVDLGNTSMATQNAISRPASSRLALQTTATWIA